MREKVPDHLRVSAMLAVIALHVSSTYIFAESSVRLFDMNAAMYVNQAARFAVPLFVLLSGMSFGMFEGGKGAARFFRSRAVKILVPYLVWGAVYFLYNNGLRFPAGWVKAFLRGISSGSFASHLYFVPLIIQLYILAYPLRYLMKKRPGAVLTLSFALSFCLQELLMLTCSGTELLGSGWFRWNVWRLFPTWLFYFAAGMYITKERLDRISRAASDSLPWLLILWLVSAVLLTLDSRATGSVDLSIKPLIMLYTALVFVTLCGVAQKAGNVRIVQRVARTLSGLSYDVYLSHVLFLMLLRRLGGVFKGTSGMLLLFIAVTACSLVYAGLIRLARQAFRKLFSRS